MTLMSAIVWGTARLTTKNESVLELSNVMGASFLGLGLFLLAIDGWELWPEPVESLCRYGSVDWETDEWNQRGHQISRQRTLARRAVESLFERIRPGGLP